MPDSNLIFETVDDLVRYVKEIKRRCPQFVAPILLNDAEYKAVTELDPTNLQQEITPVVGGVRIYSETQWEAWNA